MSAFEHKARCESRWQGRWQLLLAAVSMVLISHRVDGRGDGFPEDCLGNLASEEFRQREEAQSKLLAWARENRDAATERFYQLSLSDENPEVGQRCLGIVRELVMDEFLSDGSGYIGIRMDEAITAVPGDPMPRAAVLVTAVMPGSAGANAGLQINDLIVGLNGKVWRVSPVTRDFTNEIIKMKPRTKVTLKVKRGEKMIDVEVTLGRRPPIPPIASLDEPEPDIEALMKQEQDEYFRKWLNQRKSGK